MNRTLFPATRPDRASSSRRRAGASLFAATAAAASLTLAAGCGEKPFAKVNGVAITKDEYVGALERSTISVPGGQPINAGRFVLDQLIGKKVIFAEAVKQGVMPTDADVNNMYATRKRIVEQQMPGKSFEDAMKEQGTSAKEIKDEMKYQLAETGLLAKRLNLKDADYKKGYDQMKGQLGFPARVQMRLIVTPAGSRNYTQAVQLLKNNVDFAEVAKQVNPPGALKQGGGLQQQPTALTALPPPWQAKVQNTAEGKSFGPVEVPPQPGQPATKAWVKVEKKMAAYSLPYEDAKPLVQQQMVQAKLVEPANQKIRTEIINQKMAADFQPADTRYMDMWKALKDQYKTNNGGAPGQTASR